MDINQYVKTTKRCITRHNYHEDEKILNHFHKIANNLIPSIEIKPIFSTDIFPEIITLEKKPFLLWDYHFWESYKTLLYMNYLVSEDSSKFESLGIKKDNVISFATAQYKLILFDVLTSKVKHPKVSYRLAQEQYFNREIMKRFPQYRINYLCDEETAIEINNVVFYTKFFVLMHELQHLRLKNDKVHYQNSVLYYQAIIDTFLDFTATDNGLERMNISKQMQEEFRQRFYHDGSNLMEEVCDFNAFRLTWQHLLNYDSKTPATRIIEQVYTAFTNCTAIINVFNYIVKFWNDGVVKLDAHYTKNEELIFDDFFDKILNYQTKMHNRLSFLRLVVYVNTVHKDKNFHISFIKGDNIAEFTMANAKTFLDVKYLATIHHEAQNLHIMGMSDNEIFNSMCLLLGNPYK